MDILDECLSKKCREEILQCIGGRCLEKYDDPIMRNLMLQTMAARNVYLEIENKLQDICSKYIKILAEKVYGIASREARIQMRTFFGSLLCYALRPPPDIDKNEYLKELIKIIIK